MINIISLEKIQALLPSLDLMKIIANGFVLYSQQKVVAPPIGELLFTSPPGDVHIKYGYIKNDDYFAY